MAHQGQSSIQTSFVFILWLYKNKVNGHSRDNICDFDLLSNRPISPYDIAHHVFVAGPECFMFPGHMRLYLGLGSFLSEW